MNATCDARLSRLVTEHLSPRERMTVSEWAERYLSIKLSANPGPWVSSRVPYMREIMDNWGDPDVQRITAMKGSQTGLTAGAYGCIFYSIDQAPGLLMFVYPDEASGRDQNNVRFIPELEANPQAARHLTSRKHDVQSGRLKLLTMDILFRNAGSEHKIESFPCKYVVGDELDRCPPGTAHLLKQRLKTFPDGKLLLIGKPGLAGEGIDHEFEQGDQRVYLVPCPHCGQYQARARNRLRWPGLDRNKQWSNDTRDYDVPQSRQAETAAMAWIKCLHCGGRCGAEHNRWQLALGVWCPLGCGVTDLVRDKDGAWIETPGTLTGPVPSGPRQHRSYHIPEWISGLLDNPYAEGVLGLLERKGEVDPLWMTDHEGRGWKAPGASADVRSLAARVEAEKAKGESYLMGTVPDGVMVLIAGVDVQPTHAWVTITGYGPGGRERWLIWFGRVACPSQPQGLSLEPLDAVLFNRLWVRQDGREQAIALRAIDTGDRSDEVYEYIAQRNRIKGTIYGVRGVGLGDRQQRIDGPYVWRMVNPDRQPGNAAKRAAAEAGVKILAINSNWWKLAVLRRLGTGARQSVEVLDDAEESQDLDQTAVWHFPIDTPRDYFEQLTSEERIDEMRNGKTRKVWRLKKGSRHNHGFDATCYAEAIAMAGGMQRCNTPRGIKGAPRTTQSQGSPRGMAGVGAVGGGVGGLAGRAGGGMLERAQRRSNRS